MNNIFPDGVYPVMLTPFTDDNKIDYKSLSRLIDWYIESGVNGLFANCQSSEMFFLSLKERLDLTKYVVEYAGDRVPVIASGHISESIDDQAEEINAIAEAGAEAVILLTNRLATESEPEDLWLSNLQLLLEKVPEEIPLGFYECPYPYKRLLSNKGLKWCAESGRFYFIKDTCCNLELIKTRLEIIEGTNLKIFNANTTTLLDSLKSGVSGFSGVMANFHPEIYSWLTASFQKEPEKALKVSDFLTMASFIEMQEYPINAKYYQKSIGNFSSMRARVKEALRFDERHRSEVEQLARLAEDIKNILN